MDNSKKLLQRLQFIKSNPKLAEILPQSEILQYINDLTTAFTVLQNAIEAGKIKGKDGKTPKPGKDYHSREEVEEYVVGVLTEGLENYDKQLSKLITTIEQRASKLKPGKDGKNAEITQAIKEEIASICRDLIELPDFDALVVEAITSNPYASRDSLELITEENEKLEQSAIKNLPEDLQKLREEIYRVGSQKSVGGTSKNAVIKLIEEYGGGTGVPDGGTTGQVLTKLSDTDGDADWQDPTGGGAVDSVNGQTGVVVLDADDIDDTSTTNKFATSTQLAKVDNISITQPVDLDALESASHAAVTVSDSAEIDFTLTGQQISASIVAGSIDETKLDASVNASLDLADSAVQPAGLTNYFLKTVDDTDDITVGATNKFATAAEKTKLGHITVTQAVDLDTIETNANNVPGIKTKTDFITVTQAVNLDTMESDIATNNAKITNATHTGEVTGATALTVDKTAITNKSLVSAATGDHVLVADASDSENLKKVTVQSIVDLAGGGGNTFNDIYIDQSGGTSDTYGVLAGTINGSNALFTVSEAVYATGTLKVWLNGQLMTQGSSEDFVETTPASGTFTFNTAPATGSLITVEYQKVVTNAGSLVYAVGTEDIEITDSTKGLILESPDTTRWRITIGNDGALIATSL